MGVVYKARQIKDGRVVALKMMRAADAAGGIELARFRREMKAVSLLQHTNVISICDIGESEGRPYFAMEFAEGGSLAQKLRGEGQPDRWAAELVEVLARAVHAAHQKGIIHRDLKPLNVLLMADGTPKVADFGLAKQVEGESLGTPSGAILGTPAYMAPEQAAGKVRDVGPAADVYALGAILYEVLTGRPPFKGETALETLQKVQSVEPVPPRQVRAAVSRDLNTICLKCLNKEPGKRYLSAEALADDLRRFLDYRPIKARPTPRWERVYKWTRRHPVVSSLTGAALLLLVAAAIGGLWYWDRYQRVKVEYYANIVKRRGVPEGVGRVEEEAARHRHLTYKVYSRAGRVEAVEIINGAQELATDHPVRPLLAQPDRPQPECRYEYQYDHQGKPIEERALDRSGRRVWALHYTQETTGYFTDPRGFIRPRTGSGAAYVSLVWSEEGWESEIRYLDRDGKPQPSAEGSFGERRQFDSRGLVVERTNLGYDGRATPHRQGWTTACSAYDSQGNKTEEAYLDAAGKPALHKDGYARITRAYDDWGNQRETAYFDGDGRPALCREGYAREAILHDPQGNRVEWAWFDRDGKPTLHEAGYARTTAEFDTHGNRVGWACFDVEGRPTVDRYGCARTTAAYDRGNQVEWACWDAAGQLAWHTDGYARQMSTYDEAGNWTERAWFGVDGRPVATKAGMARMTQQFDDQGNLVAWAFFGPDGKPALHQNGFARATRTYDERGNCTCERQLSW
jgi:hypothetical protein